MAKRVVSSSLQSLCFPGRLSALSSAVREGRAFLLHIAQGSFKVFCSSAFCCVGDVRASYHYTTGLHPQHGDNIFNTDIPLESFQIHLNIMLFG